MMVALAMRVVIPLGVGNFIIEWTVDGMDLKFSKQCLSITSTDDPSSTYTLRTKYPSASDSTMIGSSKMQGVSPQASSTLMSNILHKYLSMFSLFGGLVIGRGCSRCSCNLLSEEHTERDDPYLSMSVSLALLTILVILVVSLEQAMRMEIVAMNFPWSSAYAFMHPDGSRGVGYVVVVDSIEFRWLCLFTIDLRAYMYPSISSLVLEWVSALPPDPPLVVSGPIWSSAERGRSFRLGVYKREMR
ncbi:hypothetical protein Tco_0025392 [Tanacetum coccineum]